MEAFLPRAGRDYAAGRNYDKGPDEESTVSRLSPWIRVRLLPEWEIAAAVLEQYGQSAASKFIDEVCWRTYWKGWLQLRPTVWDDYLNDLARLQETFHAHSTYQKTIVGRTGIECFDAWNHELLENNYLHNHARMWYASIWIHTLQLPWQLGADWFLRHLLDGDPASNSLSWRWVAGLHTRGKTYLARPDTIREFTGGRFQVTETLAGAAIEIDEHPLPQPRPLPQLERPPEGLRLGLLVTEEDLSAPEWIGESYPISGTARFFPRESYGTLTISPKVIDFRYQSLVAGKADADSVIENPTDLVNWAKREKLDGILTAEPTTGHWPQIHADLKTDLGEANIQLFTVRHWWDEHFFPHATHGFFRFKKAIPAALEPKRIG